MSETETVRIRPLLAEDVGRVSAGLGLARLYQGDGATWLRGPATSPSGMSIWR